MTQDDKEAAVEFVRGASLVLLTLGAFIGLLILVNGGGGENKEATKFEVVDHYKNCDVVRYTDPTQRWEYFLHCEP
jgi:hypothetical protein